MPPLESPDTHYFAAAVGWLELGNAAEARAELDQIRPAQQDQADVLEVRWLIFAAEKHWAEALGAARALVKRAPKRASGWLHQAYALRRAPDGGVQPAWDALLPAFDNFPKEPTIAYNLACYACQMGKLDAARLWLQRAAAIGGLENINRMALADADLEPLWGEIKGR